MQDPNGADSHIISLSQVQRIIFCINRTCPNFRITYDVPIGTNETRLFMNIINYIFKLIINKILYLVVNYNLQRHSTNNLNDCITIYLNIDAPDCSLSLTIYIILVKPGYYWYSW